MRDTGYGRFADDGRSVTAKLGSKVAAAAEALFDDDIEKPERRGMPKKGEKPNDFMDLDTLSKEEKPGAGDKEKETFDQMLGDDDSAAGKGAEPPEKGKEGKDGDDKKNAADKGKKDDDKKDDDKKEPENPVAEAANAAENLAEALEELSEVFDDMKS